MIKQIKFGKYDAVEVCTGKIKAVVITEIGPRIAFFGKCDGENILYWDPDGMQRGDWKLYGGHRVWITRPMADESEDTYLADNDRCNVEMFDDSVVVTSPENKINHLSKGMEIKIISEDTIMVKNFVKNEGGLIYSVGVWSPTCVNPNNTKMIIPLGQDNSTWDVIHIEVPVVFAGNKTVLEDDQAQFVGNDLVVTPKGRVLKRVVCAPKGIIRLQCNGFTFEKYVPYNKLERYPFNGCNLACFVGPDNFMGELESFGGETELIPGATASNTEYWSIK